MYIHTYAYAIAATRWRWKMKAPSRALQTRQIPRRPTTPACFLSVKLHSRRFRSCSSPAGSYHRPRVGGIILILGTCIHFWKVLYIV